MISSILLAAGQSKRMNGQNKLTKEINGIPLIKYSINNILESDINELIIVVDKLLTGFDAPTCTYLYIDKSMKDHGLFQAICRTNRPELKEWRPGHYAACHRIDEMGAGKGLPPIRLEQNLGQVSQ